MGSEWRIRRFRTGPRSEPRGHVSFPRSPVAGVRLASEGVRSVPPVPRRCKAERRIRARPSVNAHPDGSARAIAPPPGAPGATTDTECPHHRRVRQTSLPRHSGGRSTQRPCRFVVDHTVRPSPAVASREGTPAGHGQHRRPARNPPGRPDRTRPSLRSETFTSRMLSPTNAHAYTDADDNRAVGLSPRWRLDRSADRFTPVPLRNGVACSCGVDERGAAGTLPGTAQGRRIPDPVPSASGPQIAGTAVERRCADAPGVAGTVPGVAGRLAGIACRVRDRGIARAGLRAGFVGTGGCRATQGLRA